MQCRPFKRQCYRPAWQFSVNQLKRLNIYLSRMLRISNMKMRRFVIIVIHRNYDAKETTNSWHFLPVHLAQHNVNRAGDGHNIRDQTAFAELRQRLQTAKRGRADVHAARARRPIT